LPCRAGEDRGPAPRGRTGVQLPDVHLRRRIPDISYRSLSGVGNHADYAVREPCQPAVHLAMVSHLSRSHPEIDFQLNYCRKAGPQGFLCTWMEEKYGGPGGDFLHAVVVMEELARAYESGFAMGLHSDIIVPYIYSFGTEEQKQKWLPGCASGEIVTALGM